ncbi:MAG: right-handed parallel beta-helix repeat-containing protein, partial [Acidaminobacteraceae bacterium]
YKTIQYAADRLRPGQTLYIKKGTYYEKLEINTSGSRDGGYITIRPYNDDEVILDGSKSSGDDMIEISGKSYIIIKDLILTNNFNRYSTGVQMKNGVRHIEINGLDISNISTTISPGSAEDGGANAIISVSRLVDRPNYDIRILNNHIYDCQLARSEAITVTQNTEKFQVINNVIHDVTNIGIDIAGHYGEFDGDYNLNQARDGIISDNIIYNAHSLYGSGAASGLYIDGARDLIVERNIVYNNDYGLTIGCENADRTASNIIVRNNLVHSNDKSGISIGGYKESAGTVENSHIYNNISYSNNKLALSSHAELSIKKTAGKIEIYNNIFYQSKTKDKELPIIISSFENDKLDINYNLYYSNDKIFDLIFETKEDIFIGFNNYRISTGYDSNSVFANPLFTIKDNTTISYDKNTPVIDLGNPYHQYKGDIDLNMKERSINDLFDAGPIEVGSKITNYVFATELSEWTDKADFNKLLIKSDSLTITFAIKSPSIGLKQQFYIDTDKILETGFTNEIIPNMGADYLIEGGTLYGYSGSGTSWSWKKLENLKYKYKDGVIEGLANLSSLELSEGDQIKLGFVTSRDFETRDGFIFMGLDYELSNVSE